MGDADEEMNANVEKWVRYGLYSAAEIDRFIDECAAAGDVFDMLAVKARAAVGLAAKRAAETGWPRTTDVDRLELVFERLDARGICALQHAGDTLSDGAEAVSDAISEERVSADRYSAYCFFHGQDIDHALDGEGLMLAFGCIDDSSGPDEVQVGRIICEEFRREGLDVDWNESPEQRIGLPGFHWQRRSPSDPRPGF